MKGTYLLQAVKADGVTVLERGTGWFLRNTWFPRDTLVATAGHVVTADDGTWLSDCYPGLSYRLLVEPHKPLVLTPVIADKDADIAFLKASTPEPAVPMFALLSRKAPALGERWASEGFPAAEGETASFPLSGTIKDPVRGLSAKGMALLIKEGTDVDWSGISGSPVCVNDQVAGILTEVTGNTNTTWATPVEAIRRLERFLTADTVRAELASQLTALYKTYEGIAALAVRLCFPVIEAGSAGAVAEELVISIWRYGPPGFARALKEMRSDHPNQDALAKVETLLRGHLSPLGIGGADAFKIRRREAKSRVAARLRRSAAAAQALRRQFEGQNLESDTGVDGLAQMLLDLPPKALLDGAAVAQKELTDAQDCEAICRAVEATLPAALSDEQVAAIDYVLGSLEGVDMDIALIELPTALEVVVELIMAAADGRPAFFLRPRDENEFPRNRYQLMPPEGGMGDGGRFNEYWDEHFIKAVPIKVPGKRFDRKTQIELIARELRHRARTQRNTNYMVLTVNAGESWELESLQARFRELKKRYPDIVFVYLPNTEERILQEYETYLSLCDIVATTSSKERDPS